MSVQIADIFSILKIKNKMKTTIKNNRLKPVTGQLPKLAYCDICGSMAAKEENDHNFICESCGFVFDPFTSKNKYIYERALLRKRIY